MKCLPEDDARILANNGISQESLSTTLGDQVKHPAQSEWETLWYHGLSAAYNRISHLFPEEDFVSTSNIVDQSVSEPTLNVSSLNADDQLLFQEDQRPERVPFAPVSESERQQRMRRALQATNERQRIAYLLGLPSFKEYITGKQAEEILKQAAVPSEPSKRQIKREAKFAQRKEWKQATKTAVQISVREIHMSHSDSSPLTSKAADHKPLVVGLTKTRQASSMAGNSETSALNKEIAENVKKNTTQAAPATAPKPKKEKAPKQPKPQKAAAPVAPTSPALIDLRVGHILRAIKHPNADSLYVSTIAMGDEEGTEHTQKDEETGKIVRTVCSGLAGLVPLEEMQDRKIIVVANLKPVNMRSIKSAAMVLAASPKQPEGADPHAADRVVELVQPPEGSEAGDKVYFEGWPYGEGKGPEKQLNPKKKQWEAIQPGFYTSDHLVVGFDASSCEEVDGSDKGNLVVEGKGVCTVKTLKGAVVR